MITFQKFDINDYQGANGANTLMVTDQNLQKIYGFSGDNLYVLPAGERAKTFFHAQKLCQWFLRCGLQKDGRVVAIGGGSVGDCVGFAASIYKRGVKLLHVPTTLLAQIDSSIGGKTALNVGAVKNAVGTFYSADTLIDTTFLNTLPKRQWHSAQGEILKYRMLSHKIDGVYRQGDWAEIVRTCAQYKQSICVHDPLDTGERHLLNLGHTLGHAMELTYRLTHGEAVANGLYYALTLSNKLGLCTESYAHKWQNEITKLFTIRPLNADVLALTQQDKKNKRGEICFVLPQDDCFTMRQLAFCELTNLLLYND